MLSPLVLPVISPQISNRNRSHASSSTLNLGPPYMSLSPPVDDVIHRLQRFAVNSSPPLYSPLFGKPSTPSPAFFLNDPSSSQSSTTSLTLDLSFSHQSKDTPNDEATVIDTFTRRPMPFELSPTSSASSDLDLSAPPNHIDSDSNFQAFVATRSRVVRFFNLPPAAASFLSAIFRPQKVGDLDRCLPTPITMWTFREDLRIHQPDSIWAVFKSHEEACLALSFSGSLMAVTTALESDLEPFHKLRRFELTAPAPQNAHISSPIHPHLSHMLHFLPSRSDPQSNSCGSNSLGTLNIQNSNYAISSNPPNPRTSFRLGDWICTLPSCSAHNFGRNLMCIGCGSPRSYIGVSSPHCPTNLSPRSLASPRFVSSPSFPPFQSEPPQLSPTYSSPIQSVGYPPTQLSPPILNLGANKQPAPTHPLLTPSGRTFASGGQVQNVSTDPLTPCIMYWPDNEPMPEQGQIRPSGVMGIPQPPILNTGNRGPISHQPGDWICKKCNYLNWRRRKVCQTCFPYAEGNGDSISAAVQTERIALLTSVLAQAHSSLGPQAVSPPENVTRSHSLTPPHNHRSFVDLSPKRPHSGVHRSQSHFDLGSQYATSQPIYQTSHKRQPSPSYSTRSLQVHAPAPLLPSFLQDMVQSPTLSPESTSSADLSSYEEYDDIAPSSCCSSSFDHNSVTKSSNSCSHLLLGNIWQFDGDESKVLSAFALPTRGKLIGGSRKSSQEQIWS